MLMGFLGFIGSLHLWDLCSPWTLLRANDTYGVPLLMGSLLTLDPIDGNRCLWGFLALWGPFGYGISAHSGPY